MLESVGSNTVKEVREETGLDAFAERLIAVQDRNKHNKPVYAYGVCKIFVLCKVVGGSFLPNPETTEIGYFAIHELPCLAEEKVNKQQIEMCFAVAADENGRSYLTDKANRRMDLSRNCIKKFLFMPIIFKNYFT